MNIKPPDEEVEIMKNSYENGDYEKAIEFAENYIRCINELKGNK